MFMTMTMSTRKMTTKGRMTMTTTTKLKKEKRNPEKYFQQNKVSFFEDFLGIVSTFPTPGQVE